MRFLFAMLVVLAALPALPAAATQNTGNAIVIECNESGNRTTCSCDDKKSCDKMKSGGYCGKGTVYCNDEGTSCSCTVELRLHNLNNNLNAAPKNNHLAPNP